MLATQVIVFYQVCNEVLFCINRNCIKTLIVQQISSLLYISDTEWTQTIQLFMCQRKVSASFVYFLLVRYQCLENSPKKIRAPIG